MTEPLCPLCGRPLGSVQVDRHHLVPRKYKGTTQEAVHRICHRKIHSVLSEKQLRDHYHSWAALRAHPDIAAFIAWVASKPPGFYAPTAPARGRAGR